MVDTLNFYMDESGTRRPDRKVGRKPAHGNDWFSMGGVLIKRSDETKARELHKEFCDRWKITYPLHSSEIRNKSGNFSWLGLKETNQEKFYEELYCLMKESPFLGIACVIDRPGYRERYFERYGKQSWILCKTAFNIVVERAAKFAGENGMRLRVYPEECNKFEDNLLKEYYSLLKADGQPFNAETSRKYDPLQSVDFGKILYDLKFKKKKSPMVQMADLYLWPMSMGGYNKNNRPFKRLFEDGKLIECVLNPEEYAIKGTKYSCFPE